MESGRGPQTSKPWFEEVSRTDGDSTKQLEVLSTTAVVVRYPGVCRLAILVDLVSTGVIAAESVLQVSEDVVVLMLEPSGRDSTRVMEALADAIERNERNRLLGAAALRGH